VELAGFAVVEAMKMQNEIRSPKAVAWKNFLLAKGKQ